MVTSLEDRVLINVVISQTSSHCIGPITIGVSFKNIFCHFISASQNSNGDNACSKNSFVMKLSEDCVSHVVHRDIVPCSKPATIIQTNDLSRSTKHLVMGKVHQMKFRECTFHCVSDSPESLSTSVA